VPIVLPLLTPLYMSMNSHIVLHSSVMASPIQHTSYNPRLVPNMSFVRNHQGNSSANQPTASTASIASSPRYHPPTSRFHAHISSAKTTQSSARHFTSCPTSMAASSQTHHYPT
jgi:hypothetical protein